MKTLILRIVVGVFVVWAMSVVVGLFGRRESPEYWVTVYIFCLPCTYLLDGLAYLWRGLTKRAADKWRA